MSYFNHAFAVTHGLLESIVYYKITSNIGESIHEKKENFFDYSFWTNLKIDEFPYLTEKQFNETISSLVEKELIKKCEVDSILYYALKL